MNKIIIAVVSVAVIAVGVVAVNSNNQPSSASDTTSFSAIQTDVKAGAKLYDVRTSQEFATGHITGATNWSLQDMQAGKIPNVGKTAKLYVYCQSGNRSSQATALLKEAGYTNVIDLGGIQDIQAAGGTLKS